MSSRTPGVIYNRARAAQLRDFSGMRWDSISPTDIDVFLDFGGKLFVVVELKYGLAKMPYGQQLAFERLASASRVPMVVLLAEHWEAAGKDIDVASACVTRYYTKRHGWRQLEDFPDTSVRTMVDTILRAHCLEAYISQSYLGESISERVNGDSNDHFVTYASDRAFGTS